MILYPSINYIDGLVEDCGISIAYALEIPQSCNNHRYEINFTKYRELIGKRFIS